MWDIMGNICKRAQGNLWGLYMEHLWEPNNMENIWVICGEYLCGLKIVYGLVWYFLVSGLMKLGPENLYLTNLDYSVVKGKVRNFCLGRASCGTNIFIKTTPPPHTHTRARTFLLYTHFFFFLISCIFDGDLS